MWQQSVRRFPFNLRPLLAITRATSSKGMGFCALGYLRMYQATNKQEYLDKMKRCLDWLMKNYSKGYSGYAWGNHFSYESRGGRIPLNVPTIVWTSLIANVFFEAYEVFKEPLYFDVAKSSCDFVLNDMKYHKDPDETICFLYHPVKIDKPTHDRLIHNSNVLGGWMLARLYQHTKDERLFSLARKSIDFTIKSQLLNGGWFYGEPKRYRWVDSFHTGYDLEAIHGYIKATGDKRNEDKLIKGYTYFMSTFFENDGTPRYYDHKTYPIDIQCASQGIQTLVNLSEYDQSSIELAKRVALWTIEHMQDPQGYFYFRKYPVITNKTPMFHWGQATMLSALAHLVKKLDERLTSSVNESSMPNEEIQIGKN
jgi:rhamnogalacturonyl hydrolase YesR